MLAASREQEAGNREQAAGNRPLEWAFRWREAFGAHWRAELLVLALLLATSGTLALLLDPDLPVHLAMGRWIVRNGGVPFTEPFAWTRQGEPYFAYSWAIQTVYYFVFDAFGTWGLRVLHGVLTAVAGAVMLVLARAARWSPWTGLMLAVGNVTMAAYLAAHLRPQILLFITVPLAWACAYRIFESERVRWPAVALVATSALAANSHLLFPLTAASWMLALTHPLRDVRRAVVLVSATVAGWLLSPYAFVWPKVFMLNFAPNALFSQPTPISELQPGVQAAFSMPLALLLVIALALLPWTVSTTRMSTRERVVAAAAWLVGFLAFAYAVRALLIWWMLLLPTVAAAVELLALAPKRQMIVRAQKMCLYAIVICLLAAQALKAKRVRGLYAGAAQFVAPSASAMVDPLVSWLECNSRPDSRARILTVFKLGSYLTWRLPQYSSSIDGRNIFPDSVARAEGYHLPRSGPVPLGPWRSADLAMVTLDYPVAAVLDTATGWRKVAASDTTGQLSNRRAALWVRSEWWERNHGPGVGCNPSSHFIP